MPMTILMIVFQILIEENVKSRICLNTNIIVLAFDDIAKDDFDDIFPNIDDYVDIAIVDNVNDDFDDILPKLLGDPMREWP